MVILLPRTLRIFYRIRLKNGINIGIPYLVLPLLGYVECFVVKLPKKKDNNVMFLHDFGKVNTQFHLKIADIAYF